MNAFFGGGGQAEGQQRASHQNPFMDFLRSMTGQPVVDAAASAAAQFGDFVTENFQVPPPFMDIHPPPPFSSGPPPASAAALRQLPTISVTAEDLVEPSNRECCICFEENNIRDKVVRLPCAHIYHPACITDWLSRHCTCPTCRYELPTGDPVYEAGRRQRMTQRRPRFARYELERMTIRELKELLPRRQSSSAMYSDKSDLIEYLISNKVVDLISTPPPVEFPSLAFLRAMGAGQLKRTMNDTGVYFDPKDVVEKEDMVQIFINSGRICLAETDTESTSDGPDTTYGHAPYTRERKRSYDMSVDDNDDDDGKIKADDNKTTAAAINKNSQESKGASVVVETVGENDEDASICPRPIGTENNSQDGGNWESDRVLEETSFEIGDEETQEDADGVKPSASSTNEAATNDAAGVEASPADDEQPDVEDEGSLQGSQDGNNDDDVMDVDSQIGIAQDDTPDEVAGSQSGNQNIEIMDMGDTPNSNPLSSTEDDSADEIVDTASNNQDYENLNLQPEAAAQPHEEENQYQRLSISQLRALARDNSVDLTNCIERGDMIARIRSGSSGTNGANVSGANTHDDSESLAFAADRVQNWTMAQLQSCGHAVGMDVSHCVDREDRIEVLLRASESQPRIAKVILAIAPLMDMNISQLRTQARGWNVNVADCLEKGEIIHRLVKSAAQRIV